MMETPVEHKAYERTIEDKQLQIIKYYGMENQLDQIIEESAEVTKAICKWKRNHRSSNCMELLGLLTEELGDLKNLIEQLELYSDFIREGIYRTREYKTNREIDRISKVK